MYAIYFEQSTKGEPAVRELITESIDSHNEAVRFCENRFNKVKSNLQGFERITYDRWQWNYNNGGYFAYTIRRS